MSTVLISTTSGWNAGDDWIREGLLQALNLRDDVNTLWWNRGWGIERLYANAPAVNLPLADYAIIAGSPEWIDRTEDLYRHCLRTETPVAILGVGKSGGYQPEHHEGLMRDLCRSGLLETAVARDTLAARTLEEIGIEAPVMCDPAIFYPPSVPGGDKVVIGWRGLGPIAGDRPYNPRWSDADHQLSTFLWEEWTEAEGQDRIVTVHDNREVAAVRKMFGAEAVRYSSDHRELMRHYWRCGHYVGARIHGLVAAVIHGATAHLIYHNNKAACADVIIARLELEGSALVTICEDGEGAIPVVPLVKPDDVWARINREKHIFRGHCQGAPGLRSLMKE